MRPAKVRIACPISGCVVLRLSINCSTRRPCSTMTCVRFPKCVSLMVTSIRLFQSSLVPQAECNWLVCTLGRPESLFQACTRPTGRVRYGRNIITLGRWTHFNRHPAHGPGATSTVSQGWAATVSSWATLGLIAHVATASVRVRPRVVSVCLSLRNLNACGELTATVLLLAFACGLRVPPCPQWPVSVRW